MAVLPPFQSVLSPSLQPIITRGKTIYAAKACALSDVPSKGPQETLIKQRSGRVLCFDFSTGE
jgi:hypothetical protein